MPADPTALARRLLRADRFAAGIGVTLAEVRPGYARARMRLRDDQPAKVFKAGETFYEPAGCLHRVSKNASTKNRSRVIAVIVHPRDAKQITIPEPKKE